MPDSKTEYEVIEKQLYEKMNELYTCEGERFEWDDQFGDTRHGSRELDALVAEAEMQGTPDEAKIICSYTEALLAESKIKTYECTSEERWHDKLEAAKVLLDRITPFVDAVLAYYKRTYS